MGCDGCDSCGSDREHPVRVDFEFRRLVATKLEGNRVSYCYQCGACVGDCPAALYGDGFNPRRIMLAVLYGLKEELLGPGSVLWQCTNCYACSERCPQEVKPVEVILALKNLRADAGLLPPPAATLIRTFESTGRTVVVGPAVQRQRQRFGLEPLPPVPMAEIAALLEPDDPPASGTAEAPPIEQAHSGPGDEQPAEAAAPPGSLQGGGPP